MKKLFVVSVIFFGIGVGCLAVAFYLYKMQGYEKSVGEGKSDIQVVYEKPGAIDLSSPEKAIQIYWEYLDYVRSTLREQDIKRYGKSMKVFDEYLNEILVTEHLLETFLIREALEARRKDMRKHILPIVPKRGFLRRYRRVIEEVTFESDTRAKVECTAYGEKPQWRLDVVYTMEMFQDGWKIIDKECALPADLFEKYMLNRVM